MMYNSTTILLCCDAMYICCKVLVHNVHYYYVSTTCKNIKKDMLGHDVQ